LLGERRTVVARPRYNGAWTAGGQLLRRFTLLAALAAQLCGCASSATINSTASIAAADTASRRVTQPAERKEEPQFAFVDGWGIVLATPDVLASFPGALRSAKGQNRTVEPCRREIARAAMPFGPAEVEAASVGPERPRADGLYEGLVEIRVVYGAGSHYEVRQSILRCTARRDGSIVGFEPADPAASRS
jgi:hypothetical protein